jgi:hypothetical protein
LSLEKLLNISMMQLTKGLILSGHLYIDISHNKYSKSSQSCDEEAQGWIQNFTIRNLWQFHKFFAKFLKFLILQKNPFRWVFIVLAKLLRKFAELFKQFVYPPQGSSRPIDWPPPDMLLLIVPKWSESPQNTMRALYRAPKMVWTSCALTYLFIWLWWLVLRIPVFDLSTNLYKKWTPLIC